jgi:L-ascorbate metabolism protein UlaG (beta-lactamase superfamily)
VFGDMALIEERFAPKVAMVPIGDRFTMGAEGAAFACKRYFTFNTVIPCHYGTFPIIDANADKFVAAMKGASAKVVVPERGKPFTV